jgi:hypothetical protein
MSVIDAFIVYCSRSYLALRKNQIRRYDRMDLQKFSSRQEEQENATLH